MQRRKKQMALALAFGVALIWLGIQIPESFSAEITLRYAANLPIGHHCTRGQELYAKLIDERTNNRVHVEVYPAGQLFSDKDLVKALPAGAVDMAFVLGVQWSGLVPAQMITELPLFYTDINHAHRMLDSKVGEIIKRENEDKGAKLLYFMDYGAVEIASKFPLRKLEDFKGRRMGAVGEVLSEAQRAWGAAPAFMGAADIYLALQRGTIEGTMAGIRNFWDRKYYEVSKHITMVDFLYGFMVVLMNKKKWDGLPQDIQKVMLEAAQEAQTWGRKEAQKADAEALELLKGKGMEVYRVPDGERERWAKPVNKVCQEIFVKRLGQEKGKQLLQLAESAR
jgi:tripartite ATP-independent transporter DctP family solute receptor